MTLILSKNGYYAIHLGHSNYPDLLFLLVIRFCEVNDYCIIFTLVNIFKLILMISKFKVLLIVGTILIYNFIACSIRTLM